MPVVADRTPGTARRISDVVESIVHAGYEQPPSLIWSLVRYALAPESLGRRLALENELGNEVATLESRGHGRHAMEAELHDLSRAILDALADLGAELDEQRSVRGRINTRLEETLSRLSGQR